MTRSEGNGRPEETPVIKCHESSECFAVTFRLMTNMEPGSPNCKGRCLDFPRHPLARSWNRHDIRGGSAEFQSFYGGNRAMVPSLKPQSLGSAGRHHGMDTWKTH